MGNVLASELTKDYLLEVERGNVDGAFIVHKFGRNSDQDNADLPADVWDGGGGGGIYTGFPTESELVECVSSSASDTTNLTISGLDENWEPQSEVVTLNGTTPVDSVGTYRRVNRVKNSGSVVFVGTVTVRHTTTTANVFAAIAPGSPTPNQSQVAAYTVPAGYTGYLLQVRASLLGGASNRSEGGIFVRSEGGVFRMNVPFSCSGGGPYIERFPGGIPYEEKTDIVVRMFAASADNLEVVGRFDLLLIKGR